MILVFILTVYTTKSIYNYYNNSCSLDNKIDSVVVATYNTPIITPTIIPSTTILPHIEPLISRGNINRKDYKESIIEPVVIENKVDKVEVKVEEKKVEKVEDKKDEVDFQHVDTFIGSITKYTLAYEECLKHSWDKDFGITASGAKVKPNHTIAMNRNIPFGTTVKIEGFSNTFTVTDRGGAIIGLKIDVYVESRAEAFKWGVQKKKVWILNWGNGKVK